MAVAVTYKLLDKHGNRVPSVEIATTDPVRWPNAKHRKILKNIPRDAYPLSWEMVRSSNRAA